MAIKSFKKLLNNAKEQDSYWVERAKINYSIAFNRFFEKKGITQSELAKVNARASAAEAESKNLGTEWENSQANVFTTDQQSELEELNQ